MLNNTILSPSEVEKTSKTSDKNYEFLLDECPGRTLSQEEIDILVEKILNQKE